MVKSSKKTEKLAVNKIEDLVHRIENADCKFNVDDTGISWDGDIYLYNGNIDEKVHYFYSIVFLGCCFSFCPGSSDHRNIREPSVSGRT